MLISTEAQTLPSITLSNYKPMGGLGFTYEAVHVGDGIFRPDPFGDNCNPSLPPQAG